MNFGCDFCVLGSRRTVDILSRLMSCPRWIPRWIPEGSPEGLYCKPDSSFRLFERSVEPCELWALKMISSLDLILDFSVFEAFCSPVRG